MKFIKLILMIIILFSHKCGFASQSSDQINVFQPIERLTQEHINEESIKRAFFTTFVLICSEVVYSNNSAAFIKNLAELKSIKRIYELKDQLQQEIDNVYNNEAAFRKRILKNCSENYYRQFNLNKCRILNNESVQLHKKILVIKDFINESKFLSAKTLRSLVEKQVYWNDLKDDSRTILSLITVFAMLYVYINILSNI